MNMNTATKGTGSNMAYEDKLTPAYVAEARVRLNSISLLDVPYGIFVDGQIVSCGTKESCQHVKGWWRLTFPTRKVSIRKRRTSDLVLGEAA